MTKADFFALFADVDDDVTICIDSPYGAVPVQSAVEKDVVFADGSSMPVLVLVGSGSGESA